MASEVFFNNRRYVLPTVASQILSGRANVSTGLDSGGILLIDTGVTSASNTTPSGWGFGRGINSASGGNNIYRFNSLNEMRGAIRGGPLYIAAENLFAPGGGNPGVSYVDYVRAATTNPSQISLTVGGRTNPLLFRMIEEGVHVNGLTTPIPNSLVGTLANNLYKGYGLRVLRDLVDSAKYRIVFYIGTWRGEYEGRNIGGITQQNPPQVLFTLSNIANVQDIIDRFNQSPDASDYFTLIPGEGNPDEADTLRLLVEGDLNLTDLELAVAVGSESVETYGMDDLTDALDTLTDSEANFILCDRFDTEARHANNIAIINHEFTYQKSIWIGGQAGRGGIAGTIAQAQQYNDDNVRLVFDGYQRQVSNLNGVETFDSFLKTCLFVGVAAGQPTQVPIKFRPITILRNQYELNMAQRELLQQAGINYSYYDNNLRLNVCSLGVTTIQFPNNQFSINEDGTSYNDQYIRVKNNLNKELAINGKRDLLATPQGANRATLSDADVIAWMTAFLSQRTASPTVDNEIISFSNIQVRRENNNVFVSYEFQPNEEVEKVFITGFVI